MKKTQRILSLLLSIIMFVTIVPTNSMFALALSNAQAIVTVESVDAMPGSTVDVEVSISNNPGIIGAIFSLNYDDNLTLINATSDDAFSMLTMTKPGRFESPCRFTWDALEISEEDIKDGVILTLTFEVSDSVVAGTKCDIEMSYEFGDVSDANLNPVEVTFVNGSIGIIDYMPGDVNSDDRVNMTDVILLRRYIAGGYDVDINILAGDVNADGRHNMNDVILIRRFAAGGYDVELLPSGNIHTHSMEAIPAKSATCTEEGNIAYWHCTVCDKYYSEMNGVLEISLDETVVNATGHTVVVDEAVEPTYEEEGLTEGSHCGVCGEILKAQEVVAPLQKDEYSITYHISNNDNYLQSIEIDNPNPETYTAQDGLVLKNIAVDGYVFDGWYDSAGASGELVKSIPAGATGNIDLYAKWTLVPYSITFDSPDVPMNSIEYTVDKGATLTNAKWFGYTFVGWSNDDGFLVNRIMPGTTGNVTLHANWTSNRNKAVAKENPEQISIIEDDTKGQFLFLYDLGQIENVPLDVIEMLGNTDTISIDREYEIDNTIVTTNENTLANTIANSTTTSSGWTLSEEWNDIYTVEEGVDETRTKTTVRTDSEGNVTGGNYFVSNSTGGSSFISANSGGSSSTSAKVTTDSSRGFNANYKSETEKYVSTKLGVTNETEVSAGVSLPVNFVEVSAGVKNTTTVSAETESGRRDTDSSDITYTGSDYVGTVDQSNSSSYFNVTQNSESNWNSTESYEKSYQQTRSTEVSNAIGEEITTKTNYSVSNSLGGSNSQHTEVGGTDSRSEEYSTRLQYSSSTSEKVSQKVTFKSNEAGYYRLINAGTIHVFGIVGYDVATNSYFTSTYSVLDDERHIFLDYSKDNALFNDCENGIIPFEIPIEVDEYVRGVTARSDNLEFDLNGTVTAYNGTKENATVLIPQYYSANNGIDESATAVKVTKITSNTFRGNTDIETIVLPVYVSEIPNNAFEGCTNLKNVIALGVTKIGANAFKGCTSLQSFTVDPYITELGDNAFEGINEVFVYASNLSVFDAAINSGSDRITIDIADMKGSLDDKKIDISNDKEYFALVSKNVNKTFNNLQINSKANETYISNITFTNNEDTPLHLNSSKVTLNRITVEMAPAFALILENDNTDISLYGAVELGTKGENAILCKNISLSKENEEVSGIINAYGDVLVCGNVENSLLLSVVDGNNNTYENITEEEFNMYLTSTKVIFDANGGSVDVNEKTVYYEQQYGELPVPVKENYTFTGWYDDPETGTQITSDSVVDVLVDQVLYAHWNPNSFTVTFDPGDGATVEETSRELTFGMEIGELPVPSKEYYGFDGWYTEDGELITSSYVASNATDITLFAHWTENAPSDWVKLSDMPSNATIVDTKYKYTLRSYKTSSSSSLSGWTKYDTKRTSWGSTQGPVYSNPSNGSRNVWSEQYVSSTTTHYVYYHRYKNGMWSNDAYASSWARHQGPDVTSPLPNGYYSSTTGQRYSGSACSQCGATNQWHLDYTYTTNNYSTRWYYQEPVYTYYFYKDENKESTTDPTGQENVSDIEEWVRYKLK